MPGITHHTKRISCICCNPYILNVKLLAEITKYNMWGKKKKNRSPFIATSVLFIFILFVYSPNVLPGFMSKVLTHVALGSTS